MRTAVKWALRGVAVLVTAAFLLNGVGLTAWVLANRHRLAEDIAKQKAEAEPDIIGDEVIPVPGLPPIDPDIVPRIPPTPLPTVPAADPTPDFIPPADGVGLLGPLPSPPP